MKETDSALVLVGSTQPSIPYVDLEKRFGKIEERFTERDKRLSEVEHISDVEIRFQKTLVGRAQHSHSVGEGSVHSLQLQGHHQFTIFGLEF